MVPGAGKLTMKFEPEDGGPVMDLNIFDFKGAGVAMGMYNTEVPHLLHPLTSPLLPFHSFFSQPYFMHSLFCRGSLEMEFTLLYSQAPYEVFIEYCTDFKPERTAIPG